MDRGHNRALVAARLDPAGLTSRDDRAAALTPGAASKPAVPLSRLAGAARCCPTRASGPGGFITATAALAQLARSSDREGSATARSYLRAMQERRHLLAETPAKTHALLGLASTLARADRAIVFTQSIAAAEDAAEVLVHAGLRAEATHSGLDRIARRGVLSRFAAGALDVVSAPQILDEGVDVPAADTAVILAASRSRRQMIQRRGRILRRKPDGRSAHFVIVFVEGTIEDPALGAHEGFLEEITELADAVRTVRVRAA